MTFMPLIFCHLQSQIPTASAFSITILYILYIISDKPTCPEGTWADLVWNEDEETPAFDVTCAVCPMDSYTGGSGLHIECVSCNTTVKPSGSLPGTTTALYRQKCYSKCNYVNVSLLIRLSCSETRLLTL